jgi:hypothetical protein
MSTTHIQVDQQDNAGKGGVMLSSIELYRSPNVWHLLHEVGDDLWIVRHQANLPSGGVATDMDVLDFMSQSSHGPEHDVLKKLLLEGDDLWLESGQHPDTAVASTVDHHPVQSSVLPD